MKSIHFNIIKQVSQFFVWALYVNNNIRPDYRDTVVPTVMGFPPHCAAVRWLWLVALCHPALLLWCWSQWEALGRWKQRVPQEPVWGTGSPSGWGIISQVLRRHTERPLTPMCMRAHGCWVAWTSPGSCLPGSACRYLASVIMRSGGIAMLWKTREPTCWKSLHLAGAASDLQMTLYLWWEAVGWILSGSVSALCVCPLQLNSRQHSACSFQNKRE